MTLPEDFLPYKGLSKLSRTQTGGFNDPQHLNKLGKASISGTCPYDIFAWCWTIAKVAPSLDIEKRNRPNAFNNPKHLNKVAKTQAMGFQSATVLQQAQTEPKKTQSSLRVFNRY